MRRRVTAQFFIQMLNAWHRGSSYRSICDRHWQAEMRKGFLKSRHWQLTKDWIPRRGHCWSYVRAQTWRDPINHDDTFVVDIMSVSTRHTEFVGAVGYTQKNQKRKHSVKAPAPRLGVGSCKIMAAEESLDKEDGFEASAFQKRNGCKQNNHRTSLNASANLGEHEKVSKLALLPEPLVTLFALWLKCCSLCIYFKEFFHQGHKRMEGWENGKLFPPCIRTPTLPSNNFIPWFVEISTGAINDIFSLSLWGWSEILTGKMHRNIYHNLSQQWSSLSEFQQNVWSSFMWFFHIAYLLVCVLLHKDLTEGTASVSSEMEPLWGQGVFVEW